MDSYGENDWMKWPFFNANKLTGQGMQQNLFNSISTWFWFLFYRYKENISWIGFILPALAEGEYILTKSLKGHGRADQEDFAVSVVFPGHVTLFWACVSWASSVSSV